MVWPLIQVNLPLMFYMNEKSISSQQYKKRVCDFFLPWRYGLSSSTTHHLSPPASLHITKNAETHPPPMRDVIIEQSLKESL